MKPRRSAIPESAMYLKAHRLSLLVAVSAVVANVGVLAPLGVVYVRRLLMDRDVELPWLTQQMFVCPPWLYVLAAGIITMLLLGKEFVLGRALAFAFNLSAIFAMVMCFIALVVALLVPLISLGRALA